MVWILKYWKIHLVIIIAFSAIVKFTMLADDNIDHVKKYIYENQHLAEIAGDINDVYASKIIRVGGGAEGIYTTPLELKRYHLVVNADKGSFSVFVTINFENGKVNAFSIDRIKKL